MTLLHFKWAVSPIPTIWFEKKRFLINDNFIKFIQFFQICIYKRPILTLQTLCQLIAIFIFREKLINSYSSLWIWGFITLVFDKKNCCVRLVIILSQYKASQPVNQRINIAFKYGKSVDPSQCCIIHIPVLW